jgi:hypothetical protein
MRKTAASFSPKGKQRGGKRIQVHVGNEKGTK